MLFSTNSVKFDLRQLYKLIYFEIDPGTDYNLCPVNSEITFRFCSRSKYYIFMCFNKFIGNIVNTYDTKRFTLKTYFMINLPLFYLV